jgi:integrase
VDLDARTLHARPTVQRIGSEWRFVEPKTDRSRRTINLPAVAVAALRAHPARLAEERLAAGERWQEWGLVFPSAVGTPLDGSNVTHRLQRLLAGAGLQRQRFHGLRHCCASLLLAQHVPMRVVMEILGHSQISLTMDTYSHVMPALRHEAAGRMDAILAGAA